MHDAPIRCHSCGHDYLQHGPNAERCAATDDDRSSPAARPCPCPGFRWVPPASVFHGSDLTIGMILT